VDDEPVLLELAEHILSAFNGKIETFSDPKTALDSYRAAARPPDLIVTDFAMHQMNGLELIQECRRLHPEQKILLVSGTVDESIFSGTGTKPDGFLAKPYPPGKLSAAVQKILAD
jgi:CheY-like chemotaxis protein